MKKVEEELKERIIKEVKEKVNAFMWDYNYEVKTLYNKL